MYHIRLPALCRATGALPPLLSSASPAPAPWSGLRCRRRKVGGGGSDWLTISASTDASDCLLPPPPTATAPAALLLFFLGCEDLGTGGRLVTPAAEAAAAAAGERL